MKENQRRLAVLISSLLALYLILSTVFYFIFPLKQEHSARDFHILLTETIHNAIEKKLDAPILLSMSMSHSTLLKSLLKKEENYTEERISEIMKAWLGDKKRVGNCSSAFLVSEKTRRYFTGDGLVKTLDPYSDPHDIWYNDFISRNVPLALDVDVDQNNRQVWTVFLNARMEDENKNVLGVCGLGITMNELQEIFNEFENKYNIKINLVDENGLVQVDTSSVNIETNYYSTQVFSKDDDYTYKKLKKGFAVTSYISQLGWYLVVRNKELKRSEFLLDPHYIIAQLFSFLLLLFAGFLISRKISRNFKSGGNAGNVDAITGLFNRNYFKEVYGEKGVFNTTRYKSIAVYDIDSFKEANDTMDGDKILKDVTEAAKQTIGLNGEIFRWGGDEFAVLMEEPVNQAYDSCKTFCHMVADEGKVTVSVGVTSVRLSDTIKKNYYRAAQGCYLVKEIGGNDVKRS